VLDRYYSVVLNRYVRELGRFSNLPSNPAGYAAMVASASAVLERKVRFFDATHVFDREPAHVYMDDCCRYTQAGNYILADFIAASILNAPGPWR